jgi:hypothetical protein
MQTTPRGWTVFDANTPVLTYEYSRYRWFVEEFRNAPPRWLIATHGDVVDFTARSDAHRSLLGSA